jgi:phospholipase C
LKLSFWKLLKRSACFAIAAAVAIPFALHGGAANAASGPCGTAKTSKKPHYTHVIWIFEENHSYGTIIGSPEAPYINEIANECGLATNYHNITHPSLPNYVGATSGLAKSKLQQFKSDCNPSKACSTSAPSIFGQTSSWKAYEESMPSKCDQSNDGNYAVRHNPPPYFTKLKGCGKRDVPFTKLAKDLSKNKLPAFSFITPNLIDDMHNGTIAEGDSWLQTNLPVILHSRAYKSGHTVVFITWDEGEGGVASKCATNTTDVGCHVATLVISPSTKPGTQSGKLFNHYSLLGTTEQLLGLPKLGLAKSAHSMKHAFGL